MVEKIREALYFSKIMSYAQGFAQLRVASKEFDWDLPFGEIAKSGALDVSSELDSCKNYGCL